MSKKTVYDTILESKHNLDTILTGRYFKEKRAEKAESELRKIAAAYYLLLPEKSYDRKLCTTVN